MPLGDAVTVPFDGTVDVHHGFLHLVALDAIPATGDGFTGQVNGLVGAALPNQLLLRTARHTGPVAVRVEVLGSAPTDGAPGETVWEDVVEASFTSPPAAMLAAFEAFHALEPWGLVGPCRVRWSGRGMDEARAAEAEPGNWDQVDSYLLQLWPDAEPRPDAVLRRTSRCAAQWHDTAG